MSNWQWFAERLYVSVMGYAIITGMHTFWQTGHPWKLAFMTLALAIMICPNAVWYRMIDRLRDRMIR